MFAPKLTDNCNVNIDPLGGAAVAFTETTLPVRFDAETLETLGDYGYGPAIGGRRVDRASAPRRKARVPVQLRRRVRAEEPLPAVRNRRRRRPESVVAEMPVDRPAYMHSFAMTEQYLVLVEFPLVVDPLRLKLAVAPFIRNYRWRPERGLRIHVFDKDGGGLVESVDDRPRSFAFHHVNAFEDGGEIVIDLITYRDAEIIDQLYLERLRAGAIPSTRPAT